jgi:hypothetical protein
VSGTVELIGDSVAVLVVLLQPKEEDQVSIAYPWVHRFASYLAKPKDKCENHPDRQKYLGQFYKKAENYLLLFSKVLF